ncbi:PhnD: phosphonate ABC transporter, periplasmic phosphonate binding protein [Tepidimonas sediminis]|uniref:PhnD: phosphonate ABC transporter, periplasmic phosphonate binding protein n=1 Tax=Tepidimonas sediminis TaxID=2588941 RepID=A0A554WUZ0_9BURK|nr:PhnD/SsuA/transferrin family substrate-binding protein [Tepidimonas sediminis]TSE27400.1 PhnD: phosphonate ABC transporter, periplasmic phosphonate binding protein [Tepidimonas sediminis]
MRQPTSDPAGVGRRLWLRSVAALALGAGGRGVGAATVLSIGITPVVVEDRLGLWRRWAAYLERASGLTVTVRPFSAYGRVVDGLRQGGLDAAWLCGYPYVLHRRELDLVATPLWRGEPRYQGYVIVREGAARHDWAALRGCTFAYADPLSNSGHLVVRHWLRQLGHDPETYFGRSFFTYAHRHVIEAVSVGLADAGAVDGYVWEWLRQRHPRRVQGTRVMWRSPSFAFPPLVARRGLPAGVRRSLAQALIGMRHDEEGAAVLAELQLDGFTTAEPAWYEPIERMAREAG